MGIMKLLGTSFSTILNGGNPTADRTVTFPDRSFTVAGTDELSPILVEYTVTGASVTSIDFSGLDINAHGGSYEIECRLINQTASNSSIQLFINNDTTSTNYWTQLTGSSAGALSSGRYNYPLLTQVIGNASFSASGLLLLASGTPCYDGIHQHGQTSAITNYLTSFRKTSTVTNITQLTFTASVANVIGIGSKIIIRRKDK